MIRNSIIHSYAGKYEWDRVDRGGQQRNEPIPLSYEMSKRNPYFPYDTIEIETWYTKDGGYVGNTRGGATRVEIDPVTGKEKPINPADYGLELRRVQVKTRRYPPKKTDDIRVQYDPLQPMRDNYAEYKAGRTTTGFIAYEIKALENLGLDYYKELEANALALGAELKGATTVDTVGVLLATFGSGAGPFGAIVSATGWLVQSLSGKKKLTKEFQDLAAKGQKDLAEINAIYAIYKPVQKNNLLIFTVLAAIVGLIIYKKKKDE